MRDLLKELTSDVSMRTRFVHPDVPRELRRRLGGGSVVRLLSRAEASAKFAARELRVAAAELRTCSRTDGRDLREVERVMQDTNALMLEARADALWPARRASERGEQKP
jgi:hypothetical protein